MNPKGVSFEFDGYKLQPSLGKIYFYYTLKPDNNKVYTFTETLILPDPLPDFSLIPKVTLDEILKSVHLILGISYWKTYCPKEIKLKKLKLSKEQAHFWNVVYTKGLGEFFYENQIDFHDLVTFPFSEHESLPLELNLSEKILLPFGGGKDSIVSGELLKKSTKSLTAFVLGKNTPIQESGVKTLGIPTLQVQRRLDPKLMELNQLNGVYNGHIPISAIYHFVSLLVGVLCGYRYIAFSNEASSNFGNVTYLGETINHQWSKSFEFETLFRNYVKTYLVKNIEIFSFLRPLYEIKIAQVFVDFPEYFKSFSSCNTNFKIQSHGLPNYAKATLGTLRRDGSATRSSLKASEVWCGKCPKCAFVFAILSAFIPKKELVDIFGKNLFNETSLVTTYKQLLGMTEIKPFDCVGTPEESQVAFYMTHQKGDYDTDAIMKMFVAELLPNITNSLESEKVKVFLPQKEHHVPAEFLTLLENH